MGVIGEEVPAPGGIHLVIYTSALGSYSSLNSVSLTYQKLPPENMREAVYHILQLFVFHVQEGADGESQFRNFSGGVVPDPVSLEQLLQASQSQFPGPQRVGRQWCWEGCAAASPHHSSRIPFEQSGGEGFWIH